MPMSTEALRKHWGAAIERRRKDQGMTRAQLAGQVKVWPETIYRIEKGTRGGSDELRLAIATALGCEAHQLYTYPSAEEQVS